MEGVSRQAVWAGGLMQDEGPTAGHHVPQFATGVMVNPEAFARLTFDSGSHPHPLPIAAPTRLPKGRPEMSTPFGRGMMRGSSEG